MAIFRRLHASIHVTELRCNQPLKTTVGVLNAKIKTKINENDLACVTIEKHPDILECIVQQVNSLLIFSDDPLELQEKLLE